MAKNKAICIHGHFYQPPRENPWLEAVEIQDSAYPFHDWDERITVECYAPNGASRLVDGDGQIIDITNNYSRISFNFGPTLLSWMERSSREEYDRIIEADRESCRRNGGHGNAIAMPYNHTIMPLTSESDRITQIVWGLSEFQRHFGRPAEGMWLPETAVDRKTLDLLALHGIRFAILAPKQARRVRRPGGKKWRDVDDGIDTTRPYLCRLPRGRSIAIFFYHPEIAHEIAFGNLLENGDRFADRLISAFDEEREEPQLIHVATDGESYGHHRPHGDMALAYALAAIERHPDVRIANYAGYLEENPPELEVEIVENSSWSCAHGVERWRSDCGCKLNPGRNWQQRWRTTLRASLDWLRDQIDPFFEKRASKLVRSPWKARDDYITVIADRSPGSLVRFCGEHQMTKLSPLSVVELLRLLEMQRHGMLMYTSCGWFFDDISGLEPVQNLKYASRAIQLADELGLSLEESFVGRLAKAESNVPELRDGAEVYRRLVRPSVSDLNRVAAHVAMEAATLGEIEENDHFCYRVVPRDFHHVGSGGSSLTIGRMETESLVTHETDDVTFAVLRLPGHDVQCAVRSTADLSDKEGLKEELLRTYGQGSLTDVVRALDRHFGDKYFTLKDLFLESRRRVLAEVVHESLERYEGVYRTLFEDSQRLMEFAREADAPLPKVFLVAAENVLNDELEAAIQEWLDEARTDRLAATLAQARRWDVPLQLEKMEPRLRAHLNRMIGRLVEVPDEKIARRAAAFVRDIQRHKMPLFAWQAQNLFKTAVGRHAAALVEGGDGHAGELFDALRSLGEALGFHDGGLNYARERTIETTQNR